MKLDNININRKLILQLKKGERCAFEKVFFLYNKRLYYFSLGYLKSKEDAEEIVQQVFLKLWERRAGLNPELSFHSYLFTIAFNFIQKRMLELMKDHELKHQFITEITDFDEHTSQALNYHFLLQHLNALIKTLPPRQASVLKLRKLEGYSLKEIGVMLNISVKTVESHLSAALKSIKQKMRECPF